MASDVDICNKALQELGQPRITSLGDNSKAARACNFAYELVRDALLRKHIWSFAIKRVILAPDNNAPVFGPGYQFELPTDYLKLHPDNETTDWKIEGRKLVTNDGDTAEVRYIARIEDTGLFDATFVEALSFKIAFEICEEMTQSKTLLDRMEQYVDKSIAEAKQAGAIETVSDEAPEDEWISQRL